MASWTEGNGVTRADGNGTFHGFDIGGFLPKSALAVDLGVGIWAGHYYYNPTLVECGAAEDSV